MALTQKRVDEIRSEAARALSTTTNLPPGSVKQKPPDFTVEISADLLRQIDQSWSQLIGEFSIDSGRQNSHS